MTDKLMSLEEIDNFAGSSGEITSLIEAARAAHEWKTKHDALASVGAKRIAELHEENTRLTKWAADFADAQQAERALAEQQIKELSQEAEKLKVKLVQREERYQSMINRLAEDESQLREQLRVAKAEECKRIGALGDAVP